MEDPRKEEIWFEAHRDEVEKMSKDCSCCGFQEEIQHAINMKEIENTALYHALSTSAQNEYMNECIVNELKNVSSKNPLLNQESMMNHIENNPSYICRGLQSKKQPAIMPYMPPQTNDNFIYLALGYLLAKFDSDKKDDKK